MNIEYARPDTARWTVLTREEAIAELIDLKDWTRYIQVWNDQEVGENHNKVFVAVTLDDDFMDWLTFSSEAFMDYDAAINFVKEAGCEHLLIDSPEYKL